MNTVVGNPEVVSSILTPSNTMEFAPYFESFSKVRLFHGYCDAKSTLAYPPLAAIASL